MRIRPEDINNFTSLKQKRAYDAKIKLEAKVHDYAKQLMRVDDASGIDFNTAKKGSVLVDGFKTDKGETLFGKLDYCPTTNKIELDVEVEKEGAPVREHYQLQKTCPGGAVDHEILIEFDPLNPGSRRTVYRTDNETGVITITEF